MAKTNGHVGKNVPNPGAAAGNSFGPMSLQEIEPELYVFGPNDLNVVFDHKTDPKTMIAKMKEGQYFEFPRLVMLTHGFWGNSKSKWMHDLKDRFIAESDQTFIIIGWGKGADFGAYKYAQSVANVEPLGKWLGALTLEMKRKVGNKIKIWGIGEGIGAHIMGIAGRISHAFHRITGKKI